MTKGTLYLIPVTLGDTPINEVIPTYNSEIIKGIKYFIVENLRTARRFLKAVDQSINIDELTFYELNKHTKKEDIHSYLNPIISNNNIGILSEAGCPAVADPGSDIVAIAQERSYKVVPLVGPSSILLSLMGSGFNGQKFTFNGYIPMDDKERKNTWNMFTSKITKYDETQIFIETPFRNIKLLEDIIKNINPQLKLCIACNLTCEDEMIETRTIKDWSKQKPDINKKNCIFLLYK